MGRDFKSLWRESNLNSEDVFELVLILILWRYLTDTVSINRSGHYKWTDPGKKFHFNSINLLKDIDKKELVSFFFNALAKWRMANGQLHSIFVMDGRNLNTETLIKAWHLVENITSGNPVKNRWQKEHNKALLDSVSSDFLIHWQFAPEYFTPGDVSQLIAGLVKRDDAVSVYDPSCGSGGLLHTALINIPNIKDVTGVSKNSFMQKFTSIRLFLLDLPFDLLNDKERIKERKFDVIITNPPFGIIDPLFRPSTGGNKWATLTTSRRSEAAYFTHLLNHLSENGTAAIILPNGILSEKTNSLLRKQIIEDNLLEAVIHLPVNIFHETRVSASILILNKKKDKKNYLLIDASLIGVKKEHRVQISEDRLQSILDLYYSYKINKDFAVKDIARCIGIDDIRKNDYDLLFATYKSPVEYVKPKSSKQLLQECLDLESELDMIKIQIDNLLI